MDFALSEEHQAVRDLARQILGDLATNDRLKELDARGEGFDETLWQQLADANLLGVAVDEAHGGSGMGFLTLCVLLQEIGRAVAPVPVVPSLALGALALGRFGDEGQKQKWLPGVVSGEVILTAALPEEGNEDATRPTVEARGGVLSGVKTCVPAAQLATRILVPARESEGGVGLYLLDPRASGVTLEEQRLTSKQPHARLVLSDAAAERVGAAERSAEILEWLVQRATTALCIVQVGVSERALEMTSEYARERVQFDRPIGSFQAVHQRAADAFIQLEAMRLTAWDAAWRLDAEEDAAEPVAIAKYWAAAGGQFVGYAAQHLHGGIGIDVDYPLHRYYLWAKQNELALGSAPIQLERLGAQLADGTLLPGS
ncbi:MAG: acyl-CoA dehydrogenase family protein [Myxococcota bacterium]